MNESAPGPKPGGQGARSARPRTGPLSKREREVFGLLAEGLSGAEIAERLVLSPETVRTHIRNAMAKLGASTRTHAVALALSRGEIIHAGEGEKAQAAAPRSGNGVPGSSQLRAPLELLIEGLLSLWDVDAGWAFLAEPDGMTLRRVAGSPGPDVPDAPATLTLGNGPIGRAALERRSQLVQAPGAESGAMVVAPMVDGGRLVGVLALATRPSRPTGRQELLLLQALASRVGEVIHTGGAGVGSQVAQALEGFRSSWSSGSWPA